jgi:hypothetical protein
MKANTRTRALVLAMIASTSLAAAIGCTASIDESSDEALGGAALKLSDSQRRDLVSKKSACPFVGAALAMKKLFVYGTPSNPVAVIAGSPLFSTPQKGSAVAAAGAGDLGQVFRVIVRGAHSKSGSGLQAPEGMFSLDLPNSLGAHAGHSFILMGNPRARDSGRLNENNLARLLGDRANGGHSELVSGQAVLRRTELGNFIARNVACDPNAVTLSRTPFKLASLLGLDIAEFTKSAGALLLKKLSGSIAESEKTQLLENLLAIAVRNSLVASATEFGLLVTTLEGSPNAVTLANGERALSVRDIEAMYAGRNVNGKYDPLTRTLPENWDSTPKTIVRFLVNTLEILKVAGTENLKNTYKAERCAETD